MRKRTTAGDEARAVAYLRVSTDEQDLGPVAQRREVERWAARSGVTIVEWHLDRLSGATSVEDRPAMLDALEAVRRHDAGLLVASKRDRIARDVVVAATVERLAADAGAKVITADGVSAADTPEGALMRGLLDLFASYERACIRARTRAALQAKRARGERYTRTAPLGWTFAGDRMVEHDGERAQLAEARLLRERGLSFAAVARKMNAAGSTCRGREWRPNTLHRALGRA